MEDVNDLLGRDTPDVGAGITVRSGEHAAVRTEHDAIDAVRMRIA